MKVCLRNLAEAPVLATVTEESWTRLLSLGCLVSGRLEFRQGLKCPSV